MVITQLEPNKLKAVTTTEGPLLIIAGPGAGKTMTLVERIVHLVADKGVAAENIMVSTFTEKAARELIMRVSNRMLEMNLRINLNEMYIGTLHSIFLRILEEYRDYTRLQKNYRMLDDFDQKFFIYDHLSEFEDIDNVDMIIGDHRTRQWDRGETLIKYVNKVHEEVIGCDELLASDKSDIKALGEIVKKYDEILAGENCLDFSTIQTEMLNLLEKRPDAVNQLHGKIHYIMVDEYQDTNTIQERILFRMTNPERKNICVVGDDDQGLYRFRGATIRNILEFPGNFAKGECGQVTLSANFRSHPGIIDFYNKWMNECAWSKNGKTFRYPKTIKPRDDKQFGDYPSVIKVSAKGESCEWYEEVYQFIQALKESSVLSDYNQIAFLCKSVKNPQIIGLSEYLEERDIRIFSPRSALFFEREEIQLLMGALIFVFPDLFEKLKWNSNAHLDVWDYYQACKDRFANELRANPGLHKTLLNWCRHKASVHLDYDQKELKADYGITSLFYELLQFPLFSRYCDADLNDNVFNLRAVYNLALFSKLLVKVEYLYNITVITSKYYVKTLRDVFNRFFRFLYDGGIEEYEDFDDYAPTGCMSIMTIHQSKGLEFPIVMVDSLNLVPRKQYSDIDVTLQDEFYRKPPYEPIEETKNYDFWRLFYTSFSRSQNLLVLTGNERDGRGMGKLPSKYFEKLYKTLPSWRECDFKATGLELEKVKPVSLKHEYSFTSDILLYENCPFQYKFYRELEFSPIRSAATLFGILVHQTIEDVHRAVLRGNASLIGRDSISDWFNLNYQGLAKRFRTYLGEGQRKAALDQVLNYAQRHEKNWDMLREAEVDVSLVKDSYILKGVIDLLRGEGDTVEVVDFKTERVKPDVNSPGDREKLDRYRRQLEIYAHIVEERTGYSVSKMHLYYTGEESGNPYITYDRASRDIEKTVKTFDGIVNLIEAKNFDKSSIEMCQKLCGNCDMRFYCGWK